MKLTSYTIRRFRDLRSSCQKFVTVLLLLAVINFQLPRVLESVFHPPRAKEGHLPATKLVGYPSHLLLRLLLRS
jgi:hypothetical protein